MKTILRAWTAMSILFLSTKINAQPTNACHIKNVVVQNVTPTAPASSPDSCHVTLDISFNIEANNGNKYAFIHAWIQSQYPNYFDCQGNYPPMGAIAAPDASDLANSIVNIGLDMRAATPTLIFTYPPDPSVPMNNAAWVEANTLPDGTMDIIVHQIDAVMPAPCGSQPTICVDVWASQSAHAQIAHCVCCSNCFSQGGSLEAQGIANCASLTYNATITNNSNSTISGVYQVHADVDGDFMFTASVDTAISASTAFSVNAGSSINVSGSIPPANQNQDLFLVITESTGVTTIVMLPTTVCAPLPVTFRTFTASRTNSNTVQLNWQTSTEINNSGFAVQRNHGNNAWQTLTFIPSQAMGGNSSSVLSYSYTDQNGSRGITQYRIRQVDIDGKFKYSEVRAVRGMGQKGKTIIYPNPSSNGTVNIIFEGDSEANRQAVLLDMNGRVVREWKNISGNSLQIDQLNSGIYNLRIIDKKTGDQTIEKFVVNR